MAERWAVATGNWSNTATWNGGTLPGSGDDVYANNFTVTINQSITANSLKIIAGTTAVAGGGFTTNGTYTFDLQLLSIGSFIGGTASALLTITGGAITLNVAGGILGDITSASSEPYALVISAGTHVITAGSVSGSAGTAMNLTGTADVTLYSSVQSLGSQTTIFVNAGTKLTVIGTITGNIGLGEPTIGIAGGALRVDAALVYGTNGGAPIDVKSAVASDRGLVFVDGGSLLSVSAPADDDWPANTAAPITLLEGGGGGTPGRYLNVGGVATPI